MLIVAMLMITDKKDVKNLNNFKNQMMDEFLLGSEVLEFTDTMKRFLHDSNLQELDLLMGVQGWRRFVFQCPIQIPPEEANLVLGAINATTIDLSLFTNEFTVDAPFLMRGRAGLMANRFAINLMQNDVAVEREEVAAVKVAPPVFYDRARGVDMAERVVGRVGLKRKVMGLAYPIQGLMNKRRTSTIVWRPVLDIKEGKINEDSWSVDLMNVATTYLVYVSLVSEEGIQEHTEEIQTMRGVYMESKLKAEKFILCEDDVMKLPFSLMNNLHQNV